MRWHPTTHDGRTTWRSHDHHYNYRIVHTQDNAVHFSVVNLLGQTPEIIYVDVWFDLTPQEADELVHRLKQNWEAVRMEEVL